jgi:hypothetical protein
MGDRAAATLLGLDEYYADQIGPNGERVATQLARQLDQPAPYDLDLDELPRYRKLAPRWHDWGTVATACRALAGRMLDLTAQGGPA